MKLARDPEAVAGNEHPVVHDGPRLCIGRNAIGAEAGSAGSAAELARSSGIRSTSISNYERGHTVPVVKVIVRLVAAMGYPLAALDSTRGYIDTMRSGGCTIVLPRLPFGRGGAGPETPRAAPPVETGAP